jgi:hypothetical protein
VVQSVAAGKFHLYPVHNVAQGIEILTGEHAGKHSAAEGTFEPESIFAKVDARLDEMARTMEKYH